MSQLLGHPPKAIRSAEGQPDGSARAAKIWSTWTGSKAAGSKLPPIHSSSLRAVRAGGWRSRRGSRRTPKARRRPPVGRPDARSDRPVSTGRRRAARPRRPADAPSRRRSRTRVGRRLRPSAERPLGRHARSVRCAVPRLPPARRQPPHRADVPPGHECLHAEVCVEGPNTRSDRELHRAEIGHG